MKNKRLIQIFIVLVLLISIASTALLSSCGGTGKLGTHAEEWEKTENKEASDVIKVAIKYDKYKAIKVVLNLDITLDRFYKDGMTQFDIKIRITNLQLGDMLSGTMVANIPPINIGEKKGKIKSVREEYIKGSAVIFSLVFKQDVESLKDTDIAMQIKDLAITMDDNAIEIKEVDENGAETGSEISVSEFINSKIEEIKQNNTFTKADIKAENASETETLNAVFAAYAKASLYDLSKISQKQEKKGDNGTITAGPVEADQYVDGLLSLMGKLIKTIFGSSKVQSAPSEEGQSASAIEKMLAIMIGQPNAKMNAVLAEFKKQISFGSVRFTGGISDKKLVSMKISHSSMIFNFKGEWLQNLLRESGTNPGDFGVDVPMLNDILKNGLDIYISPIAIESAYRYSCDKSISFN